MAASSSTSKKHQSDAPLIIVKKNTYFDFLQSGYEKISFYDPNDSGESGKLTIDINGKKVHNHEFYTGEIFREIIKKEILPHFVIKDKNANKHDPVEIITKREMIKQYSFKKDYSQVTLEALCFYHTIKHRYQILLDKWNEKFISTKESNEALSSISICDFFKIDSKDIVGGIGTSPKLDVGVFFSIIQGHFFLIKEYGESFLNKKLYIHRQKAIDYGVLPKNTKVFATEAIQLKDLNCVYVEVSIEEILQYINQILYSSVIHSWYCINQNSYVLLSKNIFVDEAEEYFKQQEKDQREQSQVQQNETSSDSILQQLLNQTNMK